MRGRRAARSWNDSGSCRSRAYGGGCSPHALRRIRRTRAAGRSPRFVPLRDDRDLARAAHRDLELPSEVLDPPVGDLNFLADGVALDVLPPEGEGGRAGLVLQGRVGDLRGAARGRDLSRGGDGGDRRQERGVLVRAEGCNAWHGNSPSHRGLSPFPLARSLRPGRHSVYFDVRPDPGTGPGLALKARPATPYSSANSASGLG